MTGRDLIMFVLENRLEDMNIFEDGNIPGYMTITQAAEKWDVGVATVRTWIKMKLIHVINIGDLTYIPSNLKTPLEEARNEKISEKLCYSVSEY